MLRIPLERHIIKTRRPFVAVIEEIRDIVGSSKAGSGPTSVGRSRRRVDGPPAPSKLVVLGELDIERASARDCDVGRLLRLLVDMPAATEELVRFLPEVGAYCPVTILVQQSADGGTRLVYDTLASAISACEDEQSVVVARGLDAEVLALLRHVAAGD